METRIQPETGGDIHTDEERANVLGQVWKETTREREGELEVRKRRGREGARAVYARRPDGWRKISYSVQR